jgi:hypothetical protein
MAPPALGRETNRRLASILLHHVVFARFILLLPSLSLLPHHLFAGTLQPRIKREEK